MMKEKLRKILAEYGHTQNDLAELLGITYQSISIKLNRKSEFTLAEVFKIVHAYNLTPEQVYDIFFSMDDRYPGKRQHEQLEENVT